MNKQKKSAKMQLKIISLLKDLQFPWLDELKCVWNPWIFDNFSMIDLLLSVLASSITINSIFSYVWCNTDWIAFSTRFAWLKHKQITLTRGLSKTVLVLILGNIKSIKKWRKQKREYYLLILEHRIVHRFRMWESIYGNF